MSVSKTLARNTAFNAAGRFWEALIALLITPYVVQTVGLPAYGVWALLAAYTGYVALFDFGISSAYAKYIAEHAVRRDYDEVSSVVSTGFFFYLVFGVVLVTVFWPLAGLVANVLSRYDVLSDEGVADALFLFRWGLALWAAAGSVAAFTSVQTGLQRMDVTNGVSFGVSLVRVAGIVFFLQWGYGIRGLLFANAVAFAVFAVASAACAFWLLPELRVSVARATMPTWRILFRYGWRTQVSRLSNLVTFETDKVVVGFVSKGTGVIALYDLGVTLANKMRQVPTLLLTALLPAASDLDAREEHERLRRLYLVSSKYLAALTVPLVLFTVACSGVLMRVWLGPGFETSAWVLRIIAFGYLANILPGAGVSIVLGKGRPDMQMKAGLIAMVSNIALTIALYLTIGFWGIPIATALSMYISWFWFAKASGAMLDVQRTEFLETVLLWPFVAAAPGFVGCLILDWAGRGYLDRMSNAAFLALDLVVFFGTYLFAIRMTPFFDSFDIEFFDRTLKLGRVPIARSWLQMPVTVAGLGRRLTAYAEKDGRGYPDWAVRYVPVARRLDLRRPPVERVLEIGANECGLALFSSWPVVVADVTVEHLRTARDTQGVRVVAADMTALPFKPGSFDACVSLDTLEHLGPKRRERALAEIAALVGESGTAVVSFPSGLRAMEAESAIRDVYSLVMGREFRWLEQHQEVGLPGTGSVMLRLTEFAGATHDVVIRKNATLWVWKWMWQVLLCGWPGRGNSVFQALIRLATPLLCRMHFGTCYRTMVWLEPRESCPRVQGRIESEDLSTG